MEVKGKERKLNKWIVRLAYCLQMQKQMDYMYSALVNDEEDADLDLEMISDRFANQARMKAFNMFEGIPEGKLTAHGVNVNQEDFERLYELPLSNYILLDDEALSHYTW